MRADATVQAGAYPLEHSKEDRAYQAYQILHWAFVAAPVIAGLDKFTMKLVDWTQYLWAPLGTAG